MGEQKAAVMSKLTGYLEIAGKIELEEITNTIGIQPTEYYTRTECKPLFMKNAKVIAGRREPTCWRLSTPEFMETESKKLEAFFIRRLSPVAKRVVTLGDRHKLRIEVVITLDRDDDESFHSCVTLRPQFLELVRRLRAAVCVDCLW